MEELLEAEDRKFKTPIFDEKITSEVRAKMFVLRKRAKTESWRILYQCLDSVSNL